MTGTEYSLLVGSMPPLLQRFWAIAGGVSVRVKVLGIVLGMIVLLGVTVTLRMRAVFTATLLDQLGEQAEALAETLAETAADMLAAGDLPALESFLRERQAHFSTESHNAPVVYVLLTAPDGRPITGTFEGAPPADLLAPRNDVSPGAAVPYQTSLGPVIESTHLLAGGGQLRLGLSTHHATMAVTTATSQIATITVLMVGIGFVAAFFLTWILTRPLLALVEAAQAVARGDFTRHTPRWANDEIGDLADAFNVMSRSLARAERERARYISGVIAAQENERRRIARELHDSTSQSLTSLLVGLRNLQHSRDPGAFDQRLDEMRAIVGRTLDEVHALAWQLRPSVLDDLGLQTALERYVEDQAARHALHIDFAARGLENRLPPEMETAIYRIVQEGLTNIVRHAQARAASLLIERRDDIVRIIIEDDGIGFDPSAHHGEKNLGLQGIYERARLFAGRVMLESEPGQGTSLFVELPLASMAERTVGHV